MVLTTFNKELYERDLKETCMEEGRAEGRKAGRAEGRADSMRLYKMLCEADRLDEWEKAVQDEEYLEKLWQEFSDEEIRLVTK